MAIRLKIDNFDRLPDGGPLSYESQGRSFEIGRQDRDWTLPDSNMFISGRQCEIRYEGGAWWLHDVSRNGTYLNGSAQRVKSPWRLGDGDRIQIGHYFISVSIDDAPAPSVDRAVPAAPRPAPSDDIWDIGGPAPPPVSRREFMPPEARGQRSADFSEQFLELPPVAPLPGFEADPRPARRLRPGGADSGSVPSGAESPFAEAPPSAFAAARPAPPGAGNADPFAEIRPLPPAFGSEAPAPSPAPQQRPPAVQDRRPADPSILRAIAVGAGVSPDIFMQRDPNDVAAEIGMVLRTVVDELALMLKARAAAKVLARGGSRTMVGAVDNNPLKFVPRAEEVFEIMFARRRPGYLDAKQSVDEAFRDLKSHEFATYAAMQAALARLLDELSPEAIEKRTPASAFSSKKARAWETFVETWESKEKPNENGMLDVFLAYFSDAYTKASKPK